MHRRRWPRRVSASVPATVARRAPAAASALQRARVRASATTYTLAVRSSLASKEKKKWVGPAYPRGGCYRLTLNVATSFFLSPLLSYLAC